MAVNRLKDEQSPYLLQHADNPVSWYPWGPEAFAAAAGSDKPILLSVGYSTCHWCHVMAHESFENDAIAAVINEHFIAVKVDREERPDVDHVYMTAVTAMTGQGGWPLTVFLTPDGKPFFGGTYFPPHTKWGASGFKDILLSIADAWRNKRQDILSSSEQITELLQSQKQDPSLTTFAQNDGTGILDAAFRHMSAQFDERHAGFGSSPKFPMPHGLCFLLRYYRRTKGSRALSMTERTLLAMARGGIRDHLGGGFHRYSTDAQWHLPHFEKMLYDQALLARAYLETFQVTGNTEYADIAEDIFAYVLRDMRHSDGGFYCAQDADSPAGAGDAPQPVHKEGAFYVWTRKEIIETLGEDQGKKFCAWYGVESEGNAALDPHGEFIGKNILFCARIPDDENAAALCRRQLFEHRRTRPKPHLDDKIIVDWNGLMISALAFGARVLDNATYVLAAQKAADFVLSRMCREGRLLHRWRQDRAGLPTGQAGIPGTLEDYAFFITALIDLYEACFEEKYLNEAKRLARVMQEFFEDPANGAFYMTAKDAEGLIMRPKEMYDGAIPSGNSAAALALLRLHSLTGEESFRQSASRIFTFFAGAVVQMPSAYTLALCAYDLYREGATQVVLTGPSTDSIAKMVKVLYKHFVPNRSVAYGPGEGKAMARVCKGRACLSPTDDPAILEGQIIV